jgi:hypothetical protein
VTFAQAPPTVDGVPGRKPSFWNRAKRELFPTAEFPIKTTLIFCARALSCLDSIGDRLGAPLEATSRRQFLSQTPREQAATARDTGRERECEQVNFNLNGE